MTNPNTQTNTFNTNDPYYLQSSDHPGLSLVTDVFEGQNFGEWRISMRIGLSTKNKLGFVDGIIGRSGARDNNVARWDRCNDMVRAWLLNGLSKEIRRSVIYSETAKQIWDELGSIFGHMSGAQLYSVKKDLSVLTQGSDSVSVYYTKMKILRDEIGALPKFPKCTCGSTKKLIEYEKEERLLQFLMRWNESYTTVRGGILMMKPLPCVADAYAMVTQEESQREVNNASQVQEDSVSMNALVGRSSSDKSNNKGGGEKKSLLCSNYKKTNHTVDKCYFLHGFPANYRDRSKKTSQENKFTGNAHGTTESLCYSNQAKFGPYPCRHDMTRIRVWNTARILRCALAYGIW